jgi:hypothetical protein
MIQKKFENFHRVLMIRFIFVILLRFFFDAMSNLLKELSLDDELIQNYLRESNLIIHDIIEKRSKLIANIILQNDQNVYVLHKKSKSII